MKTKTIELTIPDIKGLLITLDFVSAMTKNRDTKEFNQMLKESIQLQTNIKVKNIFKKSVIKN